MTEKTEECPQHLTTCFYHHATEILYDSFGYPYCPDCDDELWERQNN